MGNEVVVPVLARVRGLYCSDLGSEVKECQEAFDELRAQCDEGEGTMEAKPAICEDLAASDAQSSSAGPWAVMALVLGAAFRRRRQA